MGTPTKLLVKWAQKLPPDLRAEVRDFEECLLRRHQRKQTV